jgi:eukaryotic-like serine/threonine-protein kinase
MLVMKRVDGTDLATKLGGRPQMGEALVALLEALMQVCRTCEFAHSRGVLHRDIKPENIMVGGFGEVYLLDWGIATKLDAKAKQTSRDEPIVGTLVYMAPEMVLGRALDARTDVYLIGATLHEVLTGQPRHGGKSMMEVARNAMLSEPFAYGPDVPDELARLCNRATAKDPAARPESVAALREAIALFLRHRAARAIADAARERLASLETLLSASRLPPSEIARAYRLVAEARFGLAQSIEQDPTNDETRDALRRCAVAAVDLELRQGHVETAEALYQELDVPAPELEARIAEGRASEQAKAKEHERLERIERDLDPTQHAARRTIPMVLLAVALTVIGTYLSVYQALTPLSALGVTVFALVLILVGLAVLWRRVMTNAFNRRGALMLVLSMLFVMLDRVIGVIRNRDPAETLTNDLLLLGLFMASASVSWMRGVWPGAVILLAGVVGLHFWPHHAAPIFTAAATANIGVCALVLARARKT